MSSVLIGIIGVILFIGLALAGALFLGPRFQAASSDSKASAHIAAIRQSSQAAALYEVDQGVALNGNLGDLSILVPGYLRKLPVGHQLRGRAAGETKAVVWMRLELNASNREICTSIQKQTGMIRSGQPMMEEQGTISTLSDRFPVGCRMREGGSELAIWADI